MDMRICCTLLSMIYVSEPLLSIFIVCVPRVSYLGAAVITRLD